MSDETKDGMTVEELRSFIQAEMKNAGLDGLGDEVLESLERHYGEWSKKSESDKTRDTAAMFRQAVANGTSPVAPFVKSSPDEVTLGGMLWAKMAASRLGLEQTRALADRHGFASEVKALEAGVFTGGGSLIDEQFSAEIIELMKPVAAVRALGARVLPVPSGSITLGRQNSSATVYWLGESDAISESQPGTGQLKLGAKKLGALVPVSNDLLRRAPAAAAAMIRQDLVTEFANAEDVGFLRGSGSEFEPKGLVSYVASGNQFDGTGTVNLDNVTVDLIKALYKVEGADHVNMASPGWLMNPRAAFGIMLLKTSDGYYPFMQEMAQSGTILAYAYRKSNNVTKATGTGSTKSRVFFGDWSQYLIADTLNFELSESDTASYGASNAKSAYARDETVIRGLHEVDGAPRHDDAFAIINEVEYGVTLDS